MEQNSWQQHIDHVSAKGVLAKRLYVIFTTPTGSIETLHAHLHTHLAYQKDLEARGITLAQVRLQTTLKQSGAAKA